MQEEHRAACWDWCLGVCLGTDCIMGLWALLHSRLLCQQWGNREQQVWDVPLCCPTESRQSCWQWL